VAGIHRLSASKLLLLLAAAAVVCLGQLPPIDSPEYAAKVVTATGRVSVLKDSQPWALEVGDSVQVRQLIVTGPDGHAVFQINDGSTFEVYPNSQVVFRKNAPNWLDLIDVLLGRVRVHIEHWGNRPNPNRVVTPTAVISVRGTTFDVSVDDDEETTFVEVEEGFVEVQHALLPRGNPVVLSPGENLRVYKSEPLAHSLIDKGTIWRHAMRMIIDAASTYATRTPKVGGIGGGAAGGGPVGDSKGGVPPPPPAPPPLPPPPPPPPVH
jgi:ferric-dicitrate binding protein FerR (iron transport regulator)